MELDVFHLFLYEPFWLKDTPFAINRVVVLMWVAAAACLAFFLIASAARRLVPKGGQNVAETAYLFVRNSIAVDIIGPEGLKYASYLATVFFFIFFCNLLEIIPFINFPVTSRMAIPAALAFLTWIIFNFLGFRKRGFRYLTETLFPPGVPWPIYIILTPIEFFSTFIIRPFTLAIRLLANMLAGHVLLTIFFLFTNDLLLSFSIGTPLGILTLVVACILIVFEFLVISIQAYVFTVLTAFYISEALHGHGEEEHDTETHAEPQREVEGLATA